MIHRFFFDGNLDTPSIALEGDEFHHLIRVMRHKIGDVIEIVNGQGEIVKASITALEKAAAILKVEEFHRERPSKPDLILAQAFIRSIEWVVEKGTEVGASQFWLFPALHSEKKGVNKERLETIAISALKQCHRLFLPKIVLKPPLEAWERPPGAFFFGDPLATVKLTKSDSSTTIVIGPEKGFALSELDCLKRLGAQGVKLHDNILRTETAALVALIQLQ